MTHVPMPGSWNHPQVEGLGAKVARIEGENHRLREALRSIYALPCAYPDDPNEDRKLADRFAEAQDIAHEVLANG